MAPDALNCSVKPGLHHYHSEKHQFYCGSDYLSVCCYCGRVQLIRYKSKRETPELMSMVGLNCGPFVQNPHTEVDVDGRVCATSGIEYIGKAHRQPDGTWRCLANVGGALCLVEVKITEQIAPSADNA